MTKYWDFLTEILSLPNRQASTADSGGPSKSAGRSERRSRALSIVRPCWPCSRRREKTRDAAAPKRALDPIQRQIAIVRSSQFVGGEAVKAHQPVSLVEPMFTDQRNLLRAARVGMRDGTEGGIIDAPQTVLAVKRRLIFEQVAHPARRVAPTMNWVLWPAGANRGASPLRVSCPWRREFRCNLAHGAGFRGEFSRAPVAQDRCRGQFDVGAQPVGPFARLADQIVRAPGTAFRWM